MKSDWETCLQLSPILWVAVLVGLAAGLRAGFRGLGLSEAVRMAVTGQVLAMVAATAMLAALIAFPEADLTSRTYFTHRHKAGCTCLACNPDLLISQPSPTFWEEEHTTGNHLSPRYYIADSMRRGAEWGFLAPVFALLGTIPAISVAFIAYPFGASKRMERKWPREDP